MVTNRRSFEQLKTSRERANEIMIDIDRIQAHSQRTMSAILANHIRLEVLSISMKKTLEKHEQNLSRLAGLK